MSDFEIIAGIKFYTKDIHSMNLTGDKFSVTLMEGTTINYPRQNEDRQAEVLLKNAGRIEFKGIQDATIIDTPENNVYVLEGCENVTVEADGGINEFDKETVGNDQDLIELSNRILPDGTIQYSRNNVLKLNKNDLYKLPNQSNISHVEYDSAEIFE